MKHAATNYYAVLGVSPDADRKAIRARYAALMQRGGKHPDLGGSHAEAARLNEAYAVLRDPVRRALYDQSCSARAPTVASAAAPPATERRTQERTPYRGLLQLSIRGKSSTVAKCRDVSSGGCSFRTVCPLAVGDKVTLCFDGAPGVTLAAGVQWVRKQPQRFGPMLYEIGVAFTTVADGLIEQLVSE